MERLERADTPEWLKEKYLQWGRKWQERLAKNPKATFNWRKHKEEKKGYE